MTRLSSLPSRAATIALAAALAVSLAACDSGGPDEPEPMDTIALGINFTRLFEAPSDADLQAIRSDWDARSPAAVDAQILDNAPLGDAVVYVVSHTMTEGPGAPFTHYGLVRVPAGVGDDAPVLVVHHGGDGGFSIQGPTANGSVTGGAAAFPELFAQTVQVFPTYRAEPLVAGIGTFDAVYTSGGSASPWDYDVDDAIALLSAALDLFDDRTDDTRVAAIGFSRGANVALLHQIRDDRVGAVTNYYGPSDFYNDVAQTLVTGILTGDPGANSLPGAPYLRDVVIFPLRNADGSYNPDADYQFASQEVARRSASLFKSDLSNVQIHHHVADGVVPIPFSQAFDAKPGTVGGAYEFNTYTAAPPAGVPSAHNAEAMPASLTATESFLLGALGVGTAQEPTLAEAF